MTSSYLGDLGNLMPITQYVNRYGHVTTTTPVTAAGLWNVTSNYTDDVNRTTVEAGGGLTSPYPAWQVALFVVLCAVIDIGTIIGNILVCATVFVVRRLRTPSNLLIVSLALSDLLVSLLVMPLATVYLVLDQWIFSETVCDAYTSMDVLLCTSSILNLCAISIDRYFVITRPFQYAMKRTPTRMAAMMAGVWLLSAVISIPPLFGWKPEFKAGKCMISQDIGYQIYATIGAFYLPLIVMIVIYTRIYLVSSRIAKAEARSQPSHGDAGGGVPTSESTMPLRKDSEPPDRLETHFVAVSHTNGISSEGAVLHATGNGNGNGREGGGERSGPRYSDSTQGSLQSHHNISQLGRAGSAGVVAPPSTASRFFHRTRPSRASSSRERKATKTLGVIMGAFTLCWLPFFIVALITPFCANSECVPPWLTALLQWLGYANSFLNPIIYARFNREFRTPFREFLLFRCRGINDRIRSEIYAEQYGAGVGSMAAATSIHHIPQALPRPHTDTAVIRYNTNSQGQTVVKLTNGDRPPSPTSGHVNNAAHSTSMS